MELSLDQLNDIIQLIQSVIKEIAALFKEAVFFCVEKFKSIYTQKTFRKRKGKRYVIISLSKESLYEFCKRTTSG